MSAPRDFLLREEAPARATLPEDVATREEEPRTVCVIEDATDHRVRICDHVESKSREESGCPKESDPEFISLETGSEEFEEDLESSHNGSVYSSGFEEESKPVKVSKELISEMESSEDSERTVERQDSFNLEASKDLDKHGTALIPKMPKKSKANHDLTDMEDGDRSEAQGNSFDFVVAESPHEFGVTESLSEFKLLERNVYERDTTEKSVGSKQPDAFEGPEFSASIEEPELCVNQEVYDGDQIPHVVSLQREATVTGNETAVNETHPDIGLSLGTVSVDTKPLALELDNARNFTAQLAVKEASEGNQIMPKPSEAMLNVEKVTVKEDYCSGEAVPLDNSIAGSKSDFSENITQRDAIDCSDQNGEGAEHTCKSADNPPMEGEDPDTMPVLRDMEDDTLNEACRVLQENRRNALKDHTVSDSGLGRVREPESTTQSGRKLIKADPSLAAPCLTSFDDDDDDDPDFPESPETPQGSQLTGGRRGLGLGYPVDAYNNVAGDRFTSWQHDMALDLATQRVSFRSERRHTLSGEQMAARSRPGSAQSAGSSGSEEVPLPHQPGSLAASELQRQFLASSQWTDMECLSLTLEEVVHIRSVLTKAELESLPVECHIKEDVARGKLCFLCMKTRFSFFGAKGNECRLCKCTVCSKCCAKMRIPTEHFASIPVYTLTPSSLSPQEDESRSILSRLHVPELPNFAAGSMPTSPHASRLSPEQPQSLPPQPLLQQVEAKLRRARLYRSRTMARPEDVDRSPTSRSDGDQSDLGAAGALMTVCKDCKAMVLHIIVTWKKRRDRSKRASAPARPRSLFISAVH